MYRIMLSDTDYNNAKVGSPQMDSYNLGFLIGRAQKLDGMMADEYQKPTELPKDSLGGATGIVPAHVQASGGGGMITPQTSTKI